MKVNYTILWKTSTMSIRRRRATLGELTMWSHGITLEELHAMIRQAREEVAGVLGIDRNFHDPRRTWWFNRKGATSSLSMTCPQISGS
jgi:hypothetical protein